MQTINKYVAENRVILKHISWDTFNQLLTELGEDRSSRLAYNEGTVEIMTPLCEHEHDNRFIDTLIGAIAEELNLNIKKVGSLTLKNSNVRRGVEPDSCYYLENEPKVRNKKNIDLDFDPAPDLVLEIDITCGSMDKLPIYAALKVPEVWRYNGRKLEVFILDKSILHYNQSEKSMIFPWLDISRIPHFLQQSLIDGETATLKAFRGWVRQHNLGQ
jgi:Uma2 family endonuclease